MYKLAKGEWSVAQLAKEFNHVIKEGKNKGYLDYKISDTALISLKDFEKENDGFVKKTTKLTKGNWRGEYNRVWVLSKRGILAMTKIQDQKEFLEMIFFVYDNYYEHDKDFVPISDLIQDFEIDNKMYRNKILPENFLSVWNKAQTNFYTDEFQKSIFNVLEHTGLKRGISYTELENSIKRNTSDIDTEKQCFKICEEGKLFMSIENKFYLSQLGFLSLLSKYSMNFKNFGKTDENKIMKIIENNKLLFPHSLTNKEISLQEYLLIFKMIFLDSFAEEHTKLSFFTIRLMMIHSYFDKIQHTKFRQYFENFKFIYKNWCDKEDCHILPISSKFKINFIPIMTKFSPKLGTKMKQNLETEKNISKYKREQNRILNLQNILWELYFLIEKVERIDEFDFPTDETNQSFESIEEFGQNEIVKSFQDIIDFQFYTYLNSVNPSSFKNWLLKSNLSDWYSQWLKILIEFHNNENTELENFTIDNLLMNSENSVTLPMLFNK